MEFFNNRIKQYILSSELLKFKGCKYQHQGISYSACDCTGFPQLVYKRCGVLKSLYKDRYCKDWHQHSSHSIILENIKKLKLEVGVRIKEVDYREDYLYIGDLLLFRFGAKMINHCGLYLGNNTFAHMVEGGNFEKTKLCLPWTKRLTKVMRATLWDTH